MTPEELNYINAVNEYAKANEITDFIEAAKKYNAECESTFIKFHNSSKNTQEILVRQMAFTVWKRIREQQHNRIISNMINYKEHE